LLGENFTHKFHTQCAQKAGFLHTSPWYIGNNTTNGWCGNYTL